MLQARLQLHRCMPGWGAVGSRGLLSKGSNWSSNMQHTTTSFSRCPLRCSQHREAGNAWQQCLCWWLQLAVRMHNSGMCWAACLALPVLASAKCSSNSRVAVQLVQLLQGLEVQVV